MLWLTAVFLTVCTLVAAQSEGDVQLMGGNDSNEGRVEVYYNNAWRAICDDTWTYMNALVACRQLGYTGTAEPVDSTDFGQGTGEQVMRKLKCSGRESRLDECEFWQSQTQWTHITCRRNSDVAGVRCSNEGGPIDMDAYDIRLVGLPGDEPTKGRVEVFYGGLWGTVCDDFWDDKDARVACREVGYPGPALGVRNAYFEPGTGPIFLDDFFCKGHESSIRECTNVGWNWHDCRHHEDAGVFCSSGEIMLTTEEGDTTASGRGNVEVQTYNGGWKPVCSKGWKQEDAQVVCNQLGFTGPAQHVRGEFPSPHLDFYITQVRCNGDEDSLLECVHDSEVDNCGEGMHAGVICSQASGDGYTIHTAVMK